MKRFRGSSRNSAFTLIELLVVMAIIAILAAMLLPALNQGKQRAQRAGCLNNFKQVGLGFHGFANDHQGKFPMAISIHDGGVKEIIATSSCVTNVHVPLGALSNELINPKLLACPADFQHRAPTNFAEVFDLGITSYKTWFHAENDGLATTIVASDGNLFNFCQLYESGALASGARNQLSWTEELHRLKGNFLFADGHVETVGNGSTLVSVVSLSASSRASSSSQMPALTPLSLDLRGATRGAAAQSAKRPVPGTNALPSSLKMTNEPSSARHTSVNVRVPSPAEFVTPAGQTRAGKPSRTTPVKPKRGMPAEEPMLGALDAQIVQFLQQFITWTYLLLLLLLLLHVGVRLWLWLRERRLRVTDQAADRDQ